MWSVNSTATCLLLCPVCTFHPFPEGGAKGKLIEYSKSKKVCPVRSMNVLSTFLGNLTRSFIISLQQEGSTSDLQLWSFLISHFLISLRNEKCYSFMLLHFLNRLFSFDSSHLDLLTSSIVARIANLWGIGSLDKGSPETLMEDKTDIRKTESESIRESPAQYCPVEPVLCMCWANTPINTGSPQTVQHQHQLLIRAIGGGLSWWTIQGHTALRGVPAHKE